VYPRLDHNENHAALAALLALLLAGGIILRIEHDELMRRESMLGCMYHFITPWD